MNKIAAKGKLDELINSDVAKAIPRLGELVRGVVLSVSNNEVIIDLKGITTGIVRGWEMVDESGVTNDLEVGKEVTATVLELENERGMVELSFRAAGHKQAWDELNRLQKEGELVTVKPFEANKGGLIVRLGQVVGFLPVSQLSSDNYPRVEGGNKQKIFDKLKELVGRELSVKIIDVNESEEKLIVSEKAIDEEKQIEALAGIKAGDELEVTVTGVVDFGVFAELPAATQVDGSKEQRIEGLIHISELAWQRVENLRGLYKTGDKIKAQVIEIRGSKVSLSIKRLQQDPWQQVAERYKVGDVIEGKVLKVNDFGAFVELDAEIHGLCHISELAMTLSEDAKASVEEGEFYKFKIVNMEPTAHRLGLSRKAALGNSVKVDLSESKPGDNGSLKELGPELKIENEK